MTAHLLHFPTERTGTQFLYRYRCSFCLVHLWAFVCVCVCNFSNDFSLNRETNLSGPRSDPAPRDRYVCPLVPQISNSCSRFTPACLSPPHTEYADNNGWLLCGFGFPWESVYRGVTVFVGSFGLSGTRSGSVQGASRPDGHGVTHYPEVTARASPLPAPRPHARTPTHVLMQNCMLGHGHRRPDARNNP